MTQDQQQDTGRRCGVEIEFAGLDVARAAALIARTAGGKVVSDGAHVMRIEGSALGDLKVELDTRYAKPADEPDLVDTMLDRLEARDEAAALLAGMVPVPVELVTPPLTREDFATLDRVISALREAGAEGTTDATLYAFGMHLNPEHRGSQAEALRIAAAFAFAERWLRAEVPPDNARRVTPFVDPYGEGYIRELGAAFDGGAPDLTTFIALYGRHNPDRNRGLDLWPLLAHLDPEAAEAAHRGPISGARPAFHYRLPDSLVSRPGWSPAAELDRWEMIEAAAADPARFDALRLAALAHRAWLPGQSAYEKAVAEILT